MSAQIPLSAEARSLRASAAAHAAHSKHGSRHMTAAARRAFNNKFYEAVDPDRKLTEADRNTRAQHAKRAYFQSLALKSAKARRARREAQASGLLP